MVLRHVSSASFAEDVHTSFAFFLSVILLTCATSPFSLLVSANMCLIVASMFCYSRMMYAACSTSPRACILQCIWYRDVPSMCYHLFVL